MNKLAYFINRAELFFGKKTAVVFRERRLSFSEINRNSNKVARALKKIGQKKGDRIAILLPNCSEYVETDFALIKGGFVRVPLNPRLSADECCYIINDSEASTLFFSDELIDKVTQIKDNLKTVKNFISVGNDTAQLKYDELLAQEDSDFFSEDIYDDDLYQILYTSGTTGRPKGAVTTFRSRQATLITTLVDEMKISSDDVFLTVAPMAHGGGTKILPHFIKGATNVLLPSFSLENFCKVVETERVTTTWMVPTMINMLLDYPTLKDYDLSSLKSVVYAAAPMPLATLKKAIETFGNIFLQVYGLSEAPNPVTILPKEDHLASVSENMVERLQSAGREAFNVRVRVVNEQGVDVKPGEIGEIITTGDNVMKEYWKKPEETAKELRDGWFYTGDMARVDDEGYVYIVDRRKDMIITGGFNVYPREVEEVLYSHPAVQDATVFGLPDILWGERVCAVIVSKEEVTAEDIISFCEGKIANYKKPTKVEFVKELPKGPTGKILKKEVKSWYLATSELKGVKQGGL